MRIESVLRQQLMTFTSPRDREYGLEDRETASVGGLENGVPDSEGGWDKAPFSGC